jgi:D-alanyl-D-alanine dipeptidase
MAAKSQANAAPEDKAEPEAQPESKKVRATDVLEEVFKAIDKAGPEGITLKALEEQTGIRCRVLHNVTWHLKTKAEKIRRVGEGRTVRYASVEAKAQRALRKRATSSQKSTSKAA